MMNLQFLAMSKSLVLSSQLQNLLVIHVYPETQTSQHFLVPHNLMSSDTLTVSTIQIMAEGQDITTTSDGTPLSVQQN